MKVPTEMVVYSNEGPLFDRPGGCAGLYVADVAMVRGVVGEEIAGVPRTEVLGGLGRPSGTLSKRASTQR